MTKHCSALVLGAILALGLAAPAFAGDGTWTEANPSGGVATELVRTDGGLYMTSDERLYFSGDDGTTWSLRASLPSSVVALSSPVGLPAVLLAATSEDGVMRSEDGGSTWSVASADLALTTIVPDPNDSGTVYGAGDGLHMSTNAGADWTALTVPAALADAVSIAVDPIDSSILYAGTPDDGIYRSADAGASWAQVATGLDLAQSYDYIFASPHADAGGTRSKLLLAASAETPTVFRSEDEGATWQEITSDLPAPDSGLTFEGLNFDPDPKFPNGIYMVFSGAHAGSTDTFFKSSDPETSAGGVGWGARPHPDGAIIGPDMHALYVSPVNLGRIVVGTDRGNYMSFDLGLSWDAYNDGFGNTHVCDLDYGGQLFAASRDGGVFASSDGGQSWTPKNAGLDLTDVTAVASDGTTVIASQADGSFLVSTNGGDSWAATGAGEPELVTAIAFGANTGQVFALDDARNGVFRSADGGNTWAFSGAGLPASAGEGDREHLAVSASDSGVVYVGTAAGVYKSTDGGVNFASAQGGLAAMQVVALAADPRDANVVYAAFDDGVTYRSSDGGASWAAAGFVTGVRAIALDPADPDRMLVATTTGVHGSVDGGGSWYEISDGYSPAAKLDGLIFLPGNGGKFAVVTDCSLKSYDGGVTSDLVLSATSTDSEIDVGGTTTVEFAVANVLGHDAPGAELDIAIGSNLRFDGITIDGVTCSVGSAAATCPLGVIPVGSEVTGTIQLKSAALGEADVDLSVTSAATENGADDNAVKLGIATTETGGGGGDGGDGDGDGDGDGNTPPTNPNPNPPQSSGGGGNGGWLWLLGLAAIMGSRRRAV